MEDQQKLYSEADIRTMRIAEEARLPGKNRVEEIINYAQKAGIKRIGRANLFFCQVPLPSSLAQKTSYSSKLPLEYRIYPSDPDLI